MPIDDKLKVDHKRCVLFDKSSNLSGFLNYNDWECISGKCKELMINSPKKTFYSRATICDNELKPGVDFRWTGERTSYALEWGLICSEESKGSNLMSFFFVGAFIGLLLGTALFDRIGRRRTTLIGITVASLSSIAATFANSYEVMLFIRVIHGLSAFISVPGVNLLSVELTPSRQRNLGELLTGLIWTLGSLINIAVCYGLKKWNYIYLVDGCILAVTAAIIFVYPESPRFLLVEGRETEARSVFRRISRIFGTQEIMENVKLAYEVYPGSYFDQIKVFKRNPIMLKNTLLLMASWFAMACMSYGLLFSWGKLGADLYVTILLSDMSGLIAKVTGLIYFIIHFFGRKKAVMISFGGLAVLFFAAVPSFGVSLGGNWRLDQVVCLGATLFVAFCWGTVLLLTKELSPTSHRGMIYCICSATCRIGAFIGPYIALLYNIVDSRIVLSLFGGLAALATFIAYFISDSTGKPIPSVPEDVIKLYADGSVEIESSSSEEIA